MIDYTWSSDSLFSLNLSNSFYWESISVTISPVSSSVLFQQLVWKSEGFYGYRRKYVVNLAMQMSRTCHSACLLEIALQSQHLNYTLRVGSSSKDRKGKIDSTRLMLEHPRLSKGFTSHKPNELRLRHRSNIFWHKVALVHLGPGAA